MPLPAQPEVPYYPPPVIFAPQGGDFGMPHNSPGSPADLHRRPAQHPH
jgi:hypothetical protein